ncbi:GNAT family N-acetyltransferase [Catenuloplanes atrovinosus]|uniref:GNAT superfamily N-acetyltransferase n=1 Tax=Catenuloplanes atrovinosus TaxID=137266 RepID=A0AAE4CBW0_9ACTN|nr:GNAT family N-acetyltransferase [Catenuloplanes atrovinosus]MDR7275970.1 GNAT superfamily N-acetyltransferase [Catenuloplanes atrovinosus]
MGCEPVEWNPNQTRDWWRSWTASDRASGTEFRVLARDASDGCVALWLIDANPPVVYLGSDGLAAVIATDVDDYAALLASGVSPSDAARLSSSQPPATAAPADPADFVEPSAEGTWPSPPRRTATPVRSPDRAEPSAAATRPSSQPPKAETEPVRPSADAAGPSWPQPPQPAAQTAEPVGPSADVAGPSWPQPAEPAVKAAEPVEPSAEAAGPSWPQPAEPTAQAAEQVEPSAEAAGPSWPQPAEPTAQAAEQVERSTEAVKVDPPVTAGPHRAVRAGRPALPSVRAAQAAYPEFPAYAARLIPSPAIRLADAGDAATLQELIATMGYDVPAAEITSRLGGLLGESNVVYVAVTDRVVGWVHVLIGHSLIVGTRAELGGLAVSADAQRTGAGAALLATAERWATRHGATSMYVRSGSDRTAAHAFYHRHGYTTRKTQLALTKPLPASSG